MAQSSKFISRIASLSCTKEKFFNFITDIRNFGRIVPGDVIKDWKADAESCSFSVSGMGDVTLGIRDKVPHSTVSFKGNVLMTIDFILTAEISDGDRDNGKVGLVMEADLNPVMKMMASGPITGFLETIVREMENFRYWDSTGS